MDNYAGADINDEEDFDEMSAGQRRAAEAAMARRDREARRGGRGARAARRSRYPGFMESDEEDVDEDMSGSGLLSGMKRRTRRQYDERRDMDDMDGVEDVCYMSSPWNLSISDYLIGATSGTTRRHQGQIYRRMDRQRARSPHHRPTFQAVPYYLH